MANITLEQRIQNQAKEIEKLKKIVSVLTNAVSVLERKIARQNVELRQQKQSLDSIKRG